MKVMIDVANTDHFLYAVSELGLVIGHDVLSLRDAGPD
jgi:hypothetical protein